MSRLTVNGQPVEFRVPPAMPLLWALREAGGLTGAKFGCGMGDCGACTVIVDGQALHSCQLSVGECEGLAVTTIEGLSPDGLHPVQAAFVTEQAIQCGFCTPGMILSVAALLDRNPAPREPEIFEAVRNLCRCGVYPRVMRAIRRASAQLLATNPLIPTTGDTL